LEATGIKKIKMPHDSILPTNFVLTSKDLTTMPGESSEIKEDYNLDYASCIGSHIYLYMSYTRPDIIIFSVNKLANIPDSFSTLNQAARTSRDADHIIL
jgi:hypothetical protein